MLWDFLLYIVDISETHEVCRALIADSLINERISGERSRDLRVENVSPSRMVINASHACGAL